MLHFNQLYTVLYIAQQHEVTMFWPRIPRDLLVMSRREDIGESVKLITAMGNANSVTKEA